MKKTLIPVLLSLLLALPVMARLSVGSRIALGARPGAPAGSGAVVGAFVTGASAAVLRAMGARVTASFGATHTVAVPLQQLGAIASRYPVSLARRMQLHNDSSLLLSNVAPAHSGQGLASPVRGDGVILGLVDVGVDFGHISFRDSLGNSRIAAVYMPADTTGSPLVIGGDTLPGSFYDTPEQIAALTTDYADGTHGTHTLGTAAGSHHASQWGGVAPGASLVVCAMPDAQLTDVNIANSVRAVKHYAQRAGKPAVVNLSLGSSEGAHDGSSPLCHAFDSLAAPGFVIVLSAGNDGNKPICLSHELAAGTDSVATLFGNRYGANNRNVAGYLSAWSATAAPHEMRLVVTDRGTGRRLWHSGWLANVAPDSLLVLSSEADASLAAHFTGTVLMANDVEPNGRFHSIVAPSGRMATAQVKLGVEYRSAVAQKLDAWACNGLYLNNYGFDGYVDGDMAMTISDLATGDHTISVGAYVSRTVDNSLGGKCSGFTAGAVQGAMAAYSSYGPDARGKMRPHVVAPGQMIVSSVSRYPYRDPSWLVEPVVADTATYRFGLDTGTSMSAPVVSGAVALMLQLNPRLTAASVIEVLASTAVRDSLVLEAGEARCGYGKIDVAAAVAHVGNSRLAGDVNGDGTVDASDVTALIDTVLGHASHPYADVNGDGAADAADVTAVINLILNP